MQLTANNEAFSELVFVGGQELSKGIGFLAADHNLDSFNVSCI